MEGDTISPLELHYKYPHKKDRNIANRAIVMGIKGLIPQPGVQLYHIQNSMVPINKKLD